MNPEETTPTVEKSEPAFKVGDMVRDYNGVLTEPCEIVEITSASDNDEGETLYLVQTGEDEYHDFNEDELYLIESEGEQTPDIEPESVPETEEAVCDDIQGLPECELCLRNPKYNVISENTTYLEPNIDFAKDTGLKYCQDLWTKPEPEPEPEPEQEPVPDTITKDINIKHDITDSELVQIADEMSNLIDSIEALEEEKRSEAKRLGDSIKAKTERLNELNSKYKTKSNWQYVTCTARFDYENNKLEWIAPDGSVAETESPIPAKYRQEKLQFPEPDTSAETTEEPTEEQEGELTPGEINEPESEQEPEPEKQIDLAEIVWDYCLNFDGVDWPKGATQLRVEKVKDKVKADNDFDHLVKQYEGNDVKNASESIQQMNVMVFWNIVMKYVKK